MARVAFRLVDSLDCFLFILWIKCFGCVPAVGSLSGCVHCFLLELGLLGPVGEMKGRCTPVLFSSVRHKIYGLIDAAFVNNSHFILLI